MPASYDTLIATERQTIEISRRAIMESIREAPSDEVRDALIRALDGLSRALEELQNAGEILSSRE
jgi:hypothetical protein